MTIPVRQLLSLSSLLLLLLLATGDPISLVSAMRRSIREPLAFNAKQRCLSAATVIHAQCDAVVVAELELGRVTVQVLLIAVLIDALHPTLEQTKEPFNRVSMNGGIFKRHVLTFAVVDRAMASHLLAYLGIVLSLVGHQPRLASDVLANELADFLAGHSADVNGADLT